MTTWLSGWRNNNNTKMNIKFLWARMWLTIVAAIIIIVTQAGGGCRKSYAPKPSQKVDASLGISKTAPTAYR
jgi:hypothetical protein